MIYPVALATYVVAWLAIFLVADGLTGRQRCGVIIGVALALHGIIFLGIGVSYAGTGAYVLAACFILAGSAVAYLSWIGVLPLTPRKTGNPDGGG